jgi:NAD(P)H-dependent FMN reductase
MSTSQTKKIAVVISTTRTKRVGPKVADFIIATLSSQLGPSDAASKIDFSLTPVAIADFNLPLFDENPVPQMVTDPANYTNERNRLWGATIASYDGFIFVTPSYNGGPPSALKNAIDFLYNEWTTKPVYIIGYGIDGGRRAATSLSVTLNDALKMKVVETKPTLVFPGVVGPALYAAMGGVLTDECVEEWKGQSAEIIRGFVELKALLAAPEELN